jgi:hypothetical protein
MSSEPNSESFMRSDTIKKGNQRAAHRSLLRATGVGEDDWKMPSRQNQVGGVAFVKGLWHHWQRAGKTCPDVLFFPQFKSARA